MIVVIRKAGMTAENARNQNQFCWFHCIEARLHPGFLQYRQEGETGFKTVDTCPHQEFVSFHETISHAPPNLEKVT